MAKNYLEMYLIRCKSYVLAVDVEFTKAGVQSMLSYYCVAAGIEVFH